MQKKLEVTRIFHCLLLSPIFRSLFGHSSIRQLSLVTVSSIRSRILFLFILCKEALVSKTSLNVIIHGSNYAFLNNHLVVKLFHSSHIFSFIFCQRCCNQHNDIMNHKCAWRILNIKGMHNNIITTIFNNFRKILSIRILQHL